MTYPELTKTAAWGQLTTAERRFVRAQWRSEDVRHKKRLDAILSRAVNKAEAVANLQTVAA